MFNQVSNRLASLAVSETLAMAQKSRELKAQGIDVIDLSIGEPDFNTPKHIKDAAIQAIHDNMTHYPPVAGYQDLREAISIKLKRDNQLDYSFDQIVVSNGAKQSITNIMLSILNTGDEVIVPSPYWVSYPEMIKLAEAKPVFVPAGIDQNFKITAEQLAAAITPKSKAFIFSSPSNPTGEIYSYEELASLAKVFSQHPDIMIISDEIYEHINYNGTHVSLASFDEIKEQVVVINGVSKAYAMTGWRIGYMAGPKWLAQAAIKLQGQYTSGASTIAQKASVAALLGDQSEVHNMVEVFRTRRDLVIKLLQDIPKLRTNNPPGAFYVMPDVSAYFGANYDGQVIADSTDLAMYLLNVGHIAPVAGSAFGAPQCIRISYSTSTELLEKAMVRMKEALSKLS